MAQSDTSILEPESWTFPQVIEHARNIAPTNIEGKPFNRMGLVYSSEQLAKIKLSELTANELQKYADIVTHAYPDAVARQLPSTCDKLSIKEINETAVAGIAYVSINAINPNTRKSAEVCLNEIQVNLRNSGR